jgi:hypothetical protein
MNLPITGISLAIDGTAFLIAASVIHARIKRSTDGVVPGTTYIRNFFYTMAFFSFCIAAAHLALAFDKSQFPLWMGIAYTYGHTIMYIGFLYIWLLISTVLPFFASKRKPIIAFWILANIAVTALTHRFTISEQRLQYQDNNITNLNAGNLVGGSIAFLALLGFIPVIILFIYNTIQATGKAKIRPALLAAGFIIMTIGGPMHDIAVNWQMFVAADIVSLLGILLIVSGIIYQQAKYD